MGGEFTSWTKMRIVSATLAGGVPLSVTLTVMKFVAPPCVSSGVHVNTPLVGLLLAPIGAPASRLQVSACAGKSGSVAELVKLSKAPSSTYMSPSAVSAGGEFTSSTTPLVVTAAPMGGEPLSVTRIVTALVLGPCASVGVQVNAPLVGLIDAPAGVPESKLK